MKYLIFTEIRLHHCQMQNGQQSVHSCISASVDGAEELSDARHFLQSVFLNEQPSRAESQN